MRRFLAAVLAVFAIHALTPGGFSTAAQAQIVAGQPAAAVLRKTDLYPGASVALDFASVAKRGQFYKANGVISPTFAGLPGLTVTRASGGYAEDQTGALVWFNSGQARITNKGLLVEEARTNYVNWSQDFANAAWSSGSPTGLTAAAGLAPDGTNTAFSWGGAGRLIRDLGAAGNGVYSNSVYIKALIGSPTVTVVVKDNVSDTVRGTTSATAGASWSRIVATGTTAAGSGVRIEISVSGGTALIWGAQVEPGSFATSYIPTTSASQPRPREDVWLIAAPPATPTILVEYDAPPLAQAVRGAFVWWDGTPANRFRLADNSSGSAEIAAYTSGASSVATVQNQGQSLRRIAWRNQVNDLRVYLNGVQGGQNTSVSLVPATASTMTIGQNLLEATPGINTYIKRVLVYPRPFSDAELQALTSGVDPSTLRLDFAAGAYKAAAGYVRTNLVTNNTFAGAVVGTIGSGGALPTGWNVSEAIQTTQVLAVGTRNGVPYMRVRVALANSSGITRYPGINTMVPATAGTVYSASFNYDQISLTGPTPTVNLQWRTAGAYLSNLAAGPYTSGFQRVFFTGAAPATTTQVEHLYDVMLPNGQSFDWTFEIGGDQIEATSYPTSLIATSGSAQSVTTYSSTNPADVGNLSFTRASTANGTDSQGNLIAFPANVPRITNTGLLVEESRTNLFPYSFDDTPAQIWPTAVNGTLSIGSLTPRAAGATVTRITASSAAPRVQRNFAVANDSVARTFSVDVEKKATTYEVAIGIVNGTSVATTLVFDGATGSITSGTGTVESKGSWWRVSVTVTNNSTGNTLLYTYVQSSVGTGGTADIALPDLQTGAFPTSYIPSRAGASATRAADVMSYAGMTALASGTMAVAGTPTAPTGATIQRALSLSGSGTDITFSRFNTQQLRYGVSGGAATIDSAVNTVPAGTLFNAAARWATNNFADALNGTSVGTSVTGTVPAYDTMNVGNLSGSQQWNGTVSRLALYGYAANDNEIAYRSAGNF